MQLGDVIMARPELLSLDMQDNKREYTPIPGKVVFIHPRHRFYTLEFKFRGNTIRESFFFPQKRRRQQ